MEWFMVMGRIGVWVGGLGGSGWFRHVWLVGGNVCVVSRVRALRCRVLRVPGEVGLGYPSGWTAAVGRMVVVVLAGSQLSASWVGMRGQNTQSNFTRCKGRVKLCVFVLIFHQIPN